MNLLLRKDKIYRPVMGRWLPASNSPKCRPGNGFQAIPSIAANSPEQCAEAAFIDHIFCRLARVLTKQICGELNCTRYCCPARTESPFHGFAQPLAASR
jgi:hypothetical protein